MTNESLLREGKAECEQDGKANLLSEKEKEREIRDRVPYK